MAAKFAWLKLPAALLSPLGHEYLVRRDSRSELSGPPRYVPPVQGVMVLDTIDGGIAREMGLRSGDILLELAEMPTDRGGALAYAIDWAPPLFETLVLRDGAVIRLPGRFPPGPRQLGIILVPEGHETYYVTMQTGSEAAGQVVPENPALFEERTLMPEFKVEAPFVPLGDQPEAIAKLTEGIRRGDRAQVLLGATGTGKTFTMAKVIEAVQKPTLVIAHNKTLAAQLASEFKEFFPQNAVEYFVSYYDYYQPEAYVAASDTYIEKDSSINDEIDKLRHSATSSLFERRDDHRGQRVLHLWPRLAGRIPGNGAVAAAGANP